jgi:hypothetical protein
MKEYIKKVLSSNSFQSFSRHGSLLALVVMLGLDVFHTVATWYNSGIPNLPGRDELVGQGVLVSSLYGSGKMGETIGKFANPDPPQADMPTPDASGDKK